VYHLLTF